MLIKLGTTVPEGALFFKWSSGKTCHNILDGRRWIWFPVAPRFDNEARQPKVEKLNVWMFETQDR